MTVIGAILQGRYQINEKIRQGGMGTIFKAKDLRLNRMVAVKSSRFTDEKLRKQFELEAQLLAFLRHPSLPIVSDHFGEGDELFLIMDYIPGEDLGEVLVNRKQPFPQRDVLRWANQLLDALNYMHGQNPPIIHRDIKPHNLKLLRDHIVLLDFGLAKGSPSPEIKVTTTGSIFGYTPQYASLEQRQGTGTDARSDLYSLGATLYHLLSAKMPADAWTRAAEVINGNPDPLQPLHLEYPQIPVALSEVIHQAMALKREARPASAAEMSRLLQGIECAETPVEALPSTLVSQALREVPLKPQIAEPSSANTDSVVTVTPQIPERAPEINLRSPVLPKQNTAMPSKFDHGFYGGLILGLVSATIMIASLVLQLGIYGGAIWLLSLTLTGALAAFFYALHAPDSVKPADVLKVGGIAGIMSAVVQWLLLILTYSILTLPVSIGSAEVLLLFVCLLGLLGGLSPLSAWLAVRYLKGEKLRSAGLKGNP